MSNACDQLRVKELKYHDLNPTDYVLNKLLFVSRLFFFWAPIVRPKNSRIMTLLTTLGINLEGSLWVRSFFWRPTWGPSYLVLSFLSTFLSKILSKDHEVSCSHKRRRNDSRLRAMEGFHINGWGLKQAPTGEMVHRHGGPAVKEIRPQCVVRS